MAVDKPTTVPYDEFSRLEAEFGQKLGNVWNRPVECGAYTYLKRYRQKHCPEGRVLDFGCGAKKPLQEILGLDDNHYHSCDNDTSGTFTYATPEEIPAAEKYELVAANQVFEHLPFAAGFSVCDVLCRRVAPGGIFLISVPNPDHPTRYRGNPTHLTPWNHLNLCALLKLGGLEVFHCVRTNKRTLNLAQKIIARVLYDIYRIDWCDTVYAVGRRPLDENGTKG